MNRLLLKLNFCNTTKQASCALALNLTQPYQAYINLGLAWKLARLLRMQAECCTGYDCEK